MSPKNKTFDSLNIYAHESKIDAKLHQTYINNMSYNNTHKVQCMIQNNEK